MLLLFNKSESLECVKVVVLKLGAILFYSAIHFMKKIYCEDLNRHIPQNINEFASPALAAKVIFVVRAEPCLGPPCATFLKLGHDRRTLTSLTFDVSIKLPWRPW